MRKGIDNALFRRVVLDREGNIVADRVIMTRPTHGVKALRKRHAAAKVSKAARKRNR